MKNLFILTLALFVSGCSLFNVRTTIQVPSGDQYIVSSKRNAVVNFSDGNVKLDVDNKGNISGYEFVLPTVLNAGRDIDIKND